MVKFSIYLNRHVFVMRIHTTSGKMDLLNVSDRSGRRKTVLICRLSGIDTLSRGWGRGVEGEGMEG